MIFIKNNKKDIRSEQPEDEKKNGPINKKILNENYIRAINQIQTSLKPKDRLFSKIIHNKVIEIISNFMTNTIARPNLILFASITAFVLSLSFYIIAKTIGYKLSGSEPIVGFLLGWSIGLIYDLIRLLVKNNN